MLTFAVALKDKGVAVPDIVKKLTIKTGKNAGKSPSVASLYRALAEAEAAAVDDRLPMRPKPVRIRQPGDPHTAEEIELRERLQAQASPERRAAADPTPSLHQAHDHRLRVNRCTAVRPGEASRIVGVNRRTGVRWRNGWHTPPAFALAGLNHIFLRAWHTKRQLLDPWATFAGEETIKPAVPGPRTRARRRTTTLTTLIDGAPPG
ncbi:hypothetical protein [Streptomyces niveus]|uniref:hypothetical protein n=1 Tax=Streptomyces niveus TaxID=193462 RepID=UPI00342302EA